MQILGSWLSQNGWKAALAFFGALLFSSLLTPLVIKVARQKGLVAKPSADRWHSTPTALFGGVAIFFAAALASLFLPLSGEFRGVATGATLVFFLGVVDDRFVLKPSTKLIGQLVAACIFTAMFYQQHPPQVIWLMPFAIFWIAGITNALNLLDNMDGLSSGVATIVALMMAAYSALSGDTNVALAALIVAGASGGFLIFNFNPAKIFMGDCGSMFLGYTLACLSLMGNSGVLSGNLFTALLLPTLVLATPLFDTVFVSINRVRHGRPISQGGRDHTSHRLVLLGFSERRAVFYLYGITAWFGLIALWGSLLNDLWAMFAVTVVSLGALLVFGQFLGEVKTYSPEEYERLKERQLQADGRRAFSRVILHKRRFMEALIDFSLICACYVVAYTLRFEQDFDVFYQRQMAFTLPYVVASQMVAFFFVRLYRGLWRYATISDLGALARGVILGTAIAWTLLEIFQSGSYSRSPLIIQSILLLLTTGSARLGLKALRYHFALVGHEDSKRVLVVGAGDAGELAVREMMNNKSLQLTPVGFIDDDPLKRHAAIHGVRVLGPRSQLLRLVEQMDIDEIVIAMPSVGNGAVREIVQNCESRGIPYREVRGVIL